MFLIYFRDQLKSHMRTHNERSHPFQCPVCQHGYITISALTNHLQKHTAPTESNRKVCSVSPINQINSTNDGVPVNPGKQLNLFCSYCEKDGFKAFIDLICHMKIIHGYQRIKNSSGKNSLLILLLWFSTN